MIGKKLPKHPSLYNFLYVLKQVCFTSWSDLCADEDTLANDPNFVFPDRSKLSKKLKVASKNLENGNWDSIQFLRYMSDKFAL